MKLVFRLLLVAYISFSTLAYSENNVLLDYLTKLSIKYAEKDVVVITDNILNGFLVDDVVKSLNSKTAFLLIDCKFSFDVHVSLQDRFVYCHLVLAKIIATILFYFKILNCTYFYKVL